MESIDRIIDANLNRLIEGLRVVEEIARLHLNEKEIVKNIKQIRHRIKKYVQKNYLNLMQARNVREDNGKFIDSISEFKRKNLFDIFIANIKRVEESSRVLEEILKLKSIKYSKIFKNIRFKIYEIEQKLAFLLKNK